MIRWNLRALCAVVVGLSTLAGRAGAQGPTGTYYLTAGDQGTNWMIQGTTATSFAQNQTTNGGEYGIAVTSTVQTMGNGNLWAEGHGLAIHPGRGLHRHELRVSRRRRELLRRHDRRHA